MKGIQKLAASCVYLFFALLAYVLLFGGEARYIIETGFSSIGNLVQNFIGLSTYTDPQRTTSFPQTWTMFYWAYWMVWCVAAPFFIGTISRGRTIRQTILGGYVFGLGGTFVSFIILGNYSLGLQVFGKLDVMGLYACQWRPLFHNHCHHPHASARPDGPRSARGGDDRLLCHQL